jgi:hypothetical protein
MCEMLPTLAPLFRPVARKPMTRNLDRTCHVSQDVLRDIGTAIWGPRWAMEMARALGVGDRTVRYWKTGEYLPPHHIWGKLADILQERRTTLAQLLERLEKEP